MQRRGFLASVAAVCAWLACPWKARANSDDAKRWQEGEFRLGVASGVPNGVYYAVQVSPHMSEYRTYVRAVDAFGLKPSPGQPVMLMWNGVEWVISQEGV